MLMEDVIRDEFGTESVTRLGEPLFNFLDKENKEVSNNDDFSDILCNVEYNYFEQGFIRGILAAKAGVITS